MYKFARSEGKFGHNVQYGIVLLPQYFEMTLVVVVRRGKQRVEETGILRVAALTDPGMFRIDTHAREEHRKVGPWRNRPGRHPCSKTMLGDEPYWPLLVEMGAVSTLVNNEAVKI